MTIANRIAKAAVAALLEGDKETAAALWDIAKQQLPATTEQRKAAWQQ